MTSFLVIFQGVLYGLHILVCVVMILAILLQAGKSAGIGAGLGGGGGQTLFGASGGQGFLAKFTTAAAIIFMLTSVGLAKLSTPSESRFEAKAKAQQEELKQDEGEEVDLEKLGVSVMPEEGEAPPTGESSVQLEGEEAGDEEPAGEPEPAEEPAHGPPAGEAEPAGEETAPAPSPAP